MKANFSSLRFEPRFLSVLLALGTLALYLPVRNAGFINFDDDDYVTANDIVKNGLTWAGIKWAFTTFHAANWHPLTWISHLTDCTLFGLNPAGPHLVNALLHAANAALLFGLLWRLTGAKWPSLLVAALFAWHPLRVESVAWIAERKDVLSLFFALLALLSYARFAAARPEEISPAAPNRSRHFWFALIFFALSLMAKPMFVTLPLILLLLDFWPMKRFALSASGFPLLLEKIPFFLLTGISCVITFLAQRAEAVRTLKQVSLALRFENAVTATATYLAQIFWPADLAVFYPLPGKIPLPDVVVSVAVLTLISALAWATRKRSPAVIIGWLWFLVVLVPVIGLVKVGDAAHADRYTYFPSIGIFLAVIFGVGNLLKSSPAQKLFIVATLAGLVACAGLTAYQLQFWRDSETLFRRALAVTGENPLVDLNLGTALVAKGEAGKEAETLLRHAIARNQTNPTAHLDLGEALEAEGLTDAALAEYREALRLDEKSSAAANNIGKLLFETGQPADALAYCQLAVRLNPGRAPLHNNLGLTLAALGRFDEALASFAEAARLDRTYASPHFQMGRALLKLGRDAEALPPFFTALQMDPNNLQMIIYTARVLASDERPAGRDGQKAFALANLARQWTGSPQPVLLDTLAMALAELRRFDEAQQLQQQAVELVKQSSDRADLEALQQRLTLYENKKPWRESFAATNAPVKN